MPAPLDPKHAATRKWLRRVGPVVLITGVLFVVVGTANFFMDRGGFGGPRYFWCNFVGAPLIFFGAVFCKLGYMGAITRYMAGEIAPVGKDVFNYTAHGTKDAVRDLAAAVGEGLRGEASSSAGARCRQCGEENDGDANFCDNCGATLTGRRQCSNCGEMSDPDARYCDHCGVALV